MSNGDDNRDTSPSTEEWEAFWQSMQYYEDANALRQAVLQAANEMWADMSPRFMKKEPAHIAVEDGEFRANMAGHVFIAALSETVYRTTVNTMFNENVLDALSDQLREQSEQDIPDQFRPENECPECGSAFDPGMDVCPNCGEEL